MSSFSMSLRSMRLSSTASTWGCSTFSITPFDEEETASICSRSLPNNNNKRRCSTCTSTSIQPKVIVTVAIKEGANMVQRPKK